MDLKSENLYFFIYIIKFFKKAMIPVCNICKNINQEKKAFDLNVNIMYGLYLMRKQIICDDNTNA